MFPTIENYIEEKYQVRNNDVTISMPLQKEIIEKAKTWRKKYSRCFF